MGVPAGESRRGEYPIAWDGGILAAPRPAVWAASMTRPGSESQNASDKANAVGSRPITRRTGRLKPLPTTAMIDRLLNQTAAATLERTASFHAARHRGAGRQTSSTSSTPGYRQKDLDVDGFRASDAQATRRAATAPVPLTSRQARRATATRPRPAPGRHRLPRRQTTARQSNCSATRPPTPCGTTSASSCSASTTARCTWPSASASRDDSERS